MPNEFTLDFRVTKVFTKLKEAYDDPYTRYIISQGGTRSGKTYGIIQLLILLALTNENITISIVRKSMPALRGSAMKDFFEILKKMKYYNEKFHSKTASCYTFANGSVVEFFSVDDSQKIRGRKRDVLYMNEANELEHEDYLQLAFRTSRKLILDFNPSDAEHWIYELAKDPKAILLKSTYKDNLFLPKHQREEIDKLILTDENYYRVYALGERPLHSTRIYSHFRTYNHKIWADNPRIVSTNYGLDFGFNHPTALVKVQSLEDGRVLVDQVLFKSGLTTKDLLMELDKVDGLRDYPIWCDSARPEIITELTRNHYKAKGANKEVKEGINSVKSSQIYVNERSTDLLKESRLYSWKSKGERILDEPVKNNDDLMDALRYAIHSPKGKTFNSKSIMFL